MRVLCIYEAPGNPYSGLMLSVKNKDEILSAFDEELTKKAFEAKSKSIVAKSECDIRRWKQEEYQFKNARMKSYLLEPEKACKL